MWMVGGEVLGMIGFVWRRGLSVQLARMSGCLLYVPVHDLNCLCSPLALLGKK